MPVTINGSSGLSLPSIYVEGVYTGNVIALPALNIDCSLGNYFTKTISQNSTFTVSNVPVSGLYSFTLQIQHIAGAITWFSGISWPGNVTPSLAIDKTHIFVFTLINGVQWRGASIINYVI